MTRNTTKRAKPLKKRPQRKCVACREMRDKDELLRVSLPPQGRGAYICKNKACIEQARKTKGLERSLKGTVPPDIYTQLLESLL
ncbi:MAG: YlxR family protein [Defluviitaleaceae bacterium]|nr:YlxR family protein [Defluviitaleaceae bacterium]